MLLYSGCGPATYHTVFWLMSSDFRTALHFSAHSGAGQGFRLELTRTSLRNGPHRAVDPADRSAASFGSASPASSCAKGKSIEAKRYLLRKAVPLTRENTKSVAQLGRRPRCISPSRFIVPCSSILIALRFDSANARGRFVNSPKGSHGLPVPLRCLGFSRGIEWRCWPSTPTDTSNIRWPCHGPEG